MNFRAVALPLLIVCGVRAQLLSPGIKVGARLTDDVGGFSLLNPESKRSIVGPTLDLKLPFHFGVEVDALYRTFGYSSEFGGLGTFSYSFQRERSNSWEFPVIGKFRIPLHCFHPFVGAGFNSRTVKGTTTASGGYSTSLSTLPYTFFSARQKTNYPVTHGLVVSGGIEFRFKHLRLAPEFRYQRWNRLFLEQYGGDGSYELFSPQNEAFIMIGLSWRK